MKTPDLIKEYIWLIRTFWQAKAISLSVINGPHSWFDHDIDIGEEIWCFFSKYLE